MTACKSAERQGIFTTYSFTKPHYSDQTLAKRFRDLKVQKGLLSKSTSVVNRRRIIHSLQESNYCCNCYQVYLKCLPFATKNVYSVNF